MKLKLHKFQLFRYLQRDLLLEVNFSFNINELLKKSEATVTEEDSAFSVIVLVANALRIEHSL